MSGKGSLVAFVESEVINRHGRNCFVIIGCVKFVNAAASSKINIMLSKLSYLLSGEYLSLLNLQFTTPH